MSNLKITDLSSLSQSALDASADFLLAVDVSDTTMSASGTNLKITPKTLVGGTINDLIQTWNSGATAFTGFKLNVTDTASDTDSSLMDLQVAGSSKFRIKKDGTIYVNGSVFSGGSWGDITGTLSSQTDLQSALDAKLSLSGGTVTGQFINSIGTITTNTPCQIFQTWNNAATTFIGLYVRATVTAAQSDSSVAAFSTNSSDLWTIRSDGALLLRGSTQNTGLYWGGGNTLCIRSPGNGRGIAVDGWAQRLIIDNLGQGVQWDSSTPLVMSSHVLHMRNGTNGQSINIYRTYTDSSNYSRFFINTDATGTKIAFGTERAGTGPTVGVDFYVNGTKMIDFNAGSVDIYFTGRSLTWGTANSGEVRLKQPTAFNGRLHIVDAASDTNFRDLVLGQIWFWGVTSSHVLLKRSSTTLQSRLGDDSGFASLQGKLTTETNYTAGAPTPTGYLVLYDAAGTAYKVPAEAL